MSFNRRGESGNVFFTLFGAVALVGVIGVATTTLMKGPVGTVVTLNQKAKVESQLQIARKLSALDAAQGTADCDTDGMIEASAPDTASTGCAGLITGGGCLPTNVGAAKLDPWGTLVGYCGWDHGVTVAGPGCPTLLAGGGNSVDKTVLAVISAGPNRSFETTCAADPAYVTKPNGSDDIVFEWTYEEASTGLGGGLWSLMSGVDAITTDKDIEVTQDATFNSGVTFSGGSTAAFSTGSTLDLSTGGLFNLPDHTQSGACTGGNVSMLRVNTGGGGQTLQICDPVPGNEGPAGDGWTDIGGSGASSAVAGGNGDIQFNSGNALWAESAFRWDVTNDRLLIGSPATANDTVEIEGTVGISSDLNVHGIIEVDAGTASNPGFTFTSANSTGLYLDSGIGMAVGGSERFLVNGGGAEVTGDLLTSGDASVGDMLFVSNSARISNNVDVGGVLFNSNGDLTVGDVMRVTSSAIFDTNGRFAGNLNANGFFVDGTIAGSTITDGNDGMVADGSGGLRLQTNGASHLHIDSAGDIGIGLAGAPTAQLDIDGILRLRNMGAVEAGDACTTDGAIVYGSGDRLLICSSMTGFYETIGATGGGGGGTVGLWHRAAGAIQPITGHAVDDFAFGNTTPGTAGSYMFFDKSAAGFRVGTVGGVQWGTMGNSSVAMGNDVNATGASAFALGQEAVAGGNYSGALGLGNATGTAPQVSATGSLGIFMGDQSGINLNVGNVMLLAGGRLVIDPDASSATAITPTNGLAIDVEGSVGAMNFCNELGTECFTAGDIASGATGAPGANREILYNSNGDMAADPRLIFSSTGGLGLNVASTATRLDVNGTIRIAYEGEACDATREGGIHYNSATDQFLVCKTAGQPWEVVAAGTTVGAAGNNRELQFNSGGQLGAMTGMVVSATGLVGFGTATPAAPLHITTGGANARSILIEGDETQSSDVNLLTAGNGVSTIGTATTRGWTMTGRGNNFGTAVARDDLLFYFWNGTAYQQRLWMSHDTGNLVIGDTWFDAGTKLAVEGSIRMSYNGEACDASREGGIQYNSSTDTFYVCRTAGSGWQAVAAGAATAAGATGQVQYNSGGLLYASASLRYDGEDMIVGAAAKPGWATGDGFETLFAGSVYSFGGFVTPDNQRLAWGNSAVNISGDSALGAMTFVTNSVEAARFTSAGRLGLGTTNPATQLDVAGTIKMAYDAEACDASREGGIHYNSSTDTFYVCRTAGAGWQALAAGAASAGGSDRTLQFNSGGYLAGDANYVFTSIGRLGLGTATPGAALHLRRSDPNVFLDLTGPGNVNIALGSGGTAFSGIAWDSPTNDFLISVDTTNTGTGDFAIVTGATTKFGIDNAGKVGIGNNYAPNTQLDVQGTIKMGYDAEACDATREGGIHYNSSTDTFYVCRTAGAGWQALAAGAASAGGSDTQVQFNSGGYLAGEANLTYTSIGGLGIGTTATDSTGYGVLYTNRRDSGTANATVLNLGVDMRVQPTGNQTAGHHSINGNFYTQVPAGSTFSIDQLSSIQSGIANTGTSAISRLSGYYGWVNNSGNSAVTDLQGVRSAANSWNGTVTNMSGLISDLDVQNSSVTNQMGLMVELTKSGTGTITNRYGVLLSATTGTATNDWGFYQTSAQPNRFGGYVGVGTAVSPAVPATQLDVAGTIKMGYDAEACDATREGGIHYNSSDDTFYVCRTAGSGWQAVSAGTASAAGSDRQLQFNSGGTFGASANLRYLSNGELSLYYYNDDTSASPREGISSFVDLDPASAQGAGKISSGIMGGISVVAGNTQQIRAARGITGYSENQGTGAVESMVGSVGYMNNTGASTGITNATGAYGGSFTSAGTVTNLYGVLADQGVSGGTVTNAFGLAVNQAATGGTITNRYGLILNVPTGTATNDWGIYQAGAQANRLGGYLGVGTASSPTLPATQLDVAGTIRMGYDAEACDATREGSIHYNSSNDTFYACRTAGSWTAIATGSASAAGSDRNIQFNSGGSFAGDNLLSFSSTGQLTIGGGLMLSGDLPLSINANTNDYAPANFASNSVLRITTDASRDLTGIAGGADGRVVTILNVGSNPLVLRNNVTSTADNRFLLSSDLTLSANQSVTLIYDATSARWRPLNSGMTSVTAAGSNYEIQFNSSGVLASNTNFVFTPTGRLGVGNTSPTEAVHVTGNLRVSQSLKLDPVSALSAPTYVGFILDDLNDVNAPSPSNGQVLLYSGGSWVSGAAGGTPAGSDRSLQFNSGGSFAGDNLLSFSSTGQLTIGGGLMLSGDLPLSINANTNDYAPANLASNSVLRITTDASRDLTGIAGGSDGRVLTILNVGSNPLVLRNDVTSTAGNRFLLGADLTLAANQSITVIYDATSARWRALSSVAAGGTGGSIRFTSLTDAPSSYTGQGMRIVRVNNAATALEFTNNVIETVGGIPAPAAFNLDDLANVAVPSPTDGHCLKYTSATTTWEPGACVSGTIGPWTINGNDIYYNSSGSPRVGIGNAAPTEALDVTGNVRLSGGLQLGLTSGIASPATLSLDALSDVVTPSPSNGQVLLYSGGNWIPGTASGGGTPGGSTRQLQFNSGGAFAGDTNLVYTATGRVGIGNAAPAEVLHVTGFVRTSQGLKLDPVAGAAAPGGLSLDDLTNVIAPSASNGQVLLYSGGNWIPGTASGGGSVTFTSLTDVPSSYSGQGGRFVKVNTGATGLEFSTQIVTSVAGQPAPTGLALSGLTDVSVSSPTNGQVLTYSAGAWVSAAASGGGGTPGGSTRQIQFNSGGAFGGDTNLVYTSTGRVGVGNAAPTEMVDVTGTVRASEGVLLGSVTGAAAPSVMTLDDLSNVAAPSASNGQVLLYSGGNWIPGTAGGGGSPAGSDRQIQFNNAGAFGGTTGFQFTSTGLLDFASNNTGTAAGSYPQFRASVDVLPSAGQTAGRDTLGVLGRANIPAGNSQQVRRIIGTYGYAENYGTGAVESMIGQLYYAYTFGGANVTSIMGAYGGAMVAGTSNVTTLTGMGTGAQVQGGTVATAIGLMIANTRTAGTISTRYDMYIEAPTGTATTEYGIYQAGTGVNYFGGNVGIGNNWADVALDVTGSIEYTGTITDVSDMRLKTDIHPLRDRGSMLDRIAMIDTYSFRMKNDLEVLEFGVMAQELEKVFPELVRTSDDEMGTKSVNYIGMMAPVIEATKELKAENDNLRSEIAALRAERDEMKTALNDLATDVKGLKAHTGYGINRAEMGLWMLLAALASCSLVVVAGTFINMRRRKS